MPTGSPGQDEGPGAAGDVAVLLCTEDEALRRAWEAVAAPRGFRLVATGRARPDDFERADPVFIVVDAAAALDADEALEAALAQAQARCVWAGDAATLSRLGAARLEGAYDCLVTPVTPAVLGQRLARWGRSIRRAAELEALGCRVEALAARNDELASRLAEMEARAEVLTRRPERLGRALERIRQVARLSREINSLDLDRIVRVCVKRLPRLIEARRASLYFYDAGDNHLVLQGHSHGYPIAKRVDLSENPHSPMAMAVARGELLLIGEFVEFEQSEDVVLNREYRDRYATASCIICPLKAGGQVRGILNLADKVGGGRFDQDIDLPVVEQIAELIGSSIYNVELYREMERRAKTDALTELPNRRAVEEALAREIDRARRYGMRLSVVMIDVDELKTINDRFGHEAGDAVLTAFADAMTDAVRSVDVPGRWGGDEFLLVLPATGADQAEQLARRLFDSVHRHPVTTGSLVEYVTRLSIGVAELGPEEDLGQLIRRADEAMYEAKRAGRDRVAVAETHAPPAEADAGGSESADGAP